jgi:hypothetical protein
MQPIIHSLACLAGATLAMASPISNLTLTVAPSVFLTNSQGGMFEVIGNTLIPAIHLFQVSVGALLIWDAWCSSFCRPHPLYRMQTHPKCKYTQWDINTVVMIDRNEGDLPPGLFPEDSDMWIVNYDTRTNKGSLLKQRTSLPGCGSGAFMKDGEMIMSSRSINTVPRGGYIRTYNGGDNWVEDAATLAGGYRWYSTSLTMPEGNVLFLGGSFSSSTAAEFNNPSFEFYPNPNNKKYDLSVLKVQEGSTVQRYTLYSFAYVLPDGNIFLLVDRRTVIWNPYTNTIVKTLPIAPAGLRNYPLTGGVLALPASASNGYWPDILACGGNSIFTKTGEATRQCGRIKTKDYAKGTSKWSSENMPSPRVMPDMVNLPNGKVLIINGAMNGVAGYPTEGTTQPKAINPNKVPVIYDPSAPAGSRFTQMNPTPIARMYHSTAMLLPDASVIVAGSSTNNPPAVLDKEYPTEMRAERFSPTYLFSNASRPIIDSAPESTTYGAKIKVIVSGAATATSFRVYMIHTGVVSHSQSMGARSLQLSNTKSTADANGKVILTITMPPNSCVAPPGKHYYLYVTRTDGGRVPSKAVQISIA